MTVKARTNAEDLVARCVKPSVAALQREQHDFDTRFEHLRLDKNERLLPFTEEQMTDLRNRIRSSDISGYAELGSVRKRIAAYLGVAQDAVLLASGSDLAIKAIYEACIRANDHIVLHLPSYAMYRVYASMFEARVTGIAVKPDWTIDLDAMLGAVESDTKMVVVENPSGFVGTQPQFEEIKFAARTLAKRDILLVVDEAYVYIEQDRSAVSSLIVDFPNVVVSQTFSKGHGLAGTRFGYLIANPALMRYVSRVRPMHEITSLTATCVEWILDHPETLIEYRNSLTNSKAWLLEALSTLGVEAKDSHANFVFLNASQIKTTDLASALAARRILVRPPFADSPVKGWARVTVGTNDDSRRLMQAISEIQAAP